MLKGLWLIALLKKRLLRSAPVLRLRQGLGKCRFTVSERLKTWPPPFLSMKRRALQLTSLSQPANVTWRSLQLAVHRVIHAAVRLASHEQSSGATLQDRSTMPWSSSLGNHPTRLAFRQLQHGTVKTLRMNRQHAHKPAGSVLLRSTCMWKICKHS